MAVNQPLKDINMCAAITSGVLAVGTAAYQIAQAEKQKKDAKRGLNEYERQELTNAFEDVPIATLGADMLLEGTNQAQANAVNSLQQAGDRAIIGGAGRIVSAGNEANQEARSYLDNQIIKRAYAMGEDEQQIRRYQENRDTANIDALSSQLQAGNQDSWNGIRGLGSAINYGANNIDFTQQRQEQEPVSNINPAGLNMTTQNALPSASIPNIRSSQRFDPYNFYGGF